MTDFVLRRLAGMGDVLMVACAAKALRHIYPDCQVGIETMAQYVPLLELCPWVSWEVAPDALRVDLIEAQHGMANCHQIDSYLRYIGVKAPSKYQKEWKTLDLNFERLPKWPRTICIHPYANDRNRMYPEWPAVSRLLQDAGFEVVMIGPETGYLEAIQIIDRCLVFASTDSGPIQMAGATETPIVGLYSVVEGRHRLPYRNPSTALQPACPFFPCYREMLQRWNDYGVEPIKNGKPVAQVVGDWCAYPNYPCMTELPPSAVAAEILKYANPS